MNDMKDFWQINIGQIGSMLFFLAGAAMVWQKMKDKLEALAKDTDKNSGDIDNLMKLGLITTVQQHERRILELEKVSEDFREMKADIRWIKGELNKDRV